MGWTVAVVLVVEDDEQVRVMADSILQDAGYETRSAATMSEAHAILVSDEKIDVLLVDMELMDDPEAGLGVAQAAAKTRQGLPVIHDRSRRHGWNACALCRTERFSRQALSRRTTPHRRSERFEVAAFIAPSRAIATF